MIISCPRLMKTYSNQPIVLMRSASYSLLASFLVILSYPSDVSISFHRGADDKQLVQHPHNPGSRTG
ncbi:hypothetical protein EUGRSUZ_I00989 [Eucalyptus grandis]|uniref:Uncharacterized protein n=2 Tax=Eucalyptus grandis TaxID=71139 RepID=A0ACC3JDM4_EUCGR|nr:hypothetical protein EUGRSUZ_I00989 [Eucalyptus grandis]